ncbi:hypothetical protein PCE1_002626 [Barthelona sp. PCE]
MEHLHSELEEYKQLNENLMKKVQNQAKELMSKQLIIDELQEFNELYQAKIAEQINEVDAKLETGGRKDPSLIATEAHHKKRYSELENQFITLENEYKRLKKRHEESTVEHKGLRDAHDELFRRHKNSEDSRKKLRRLIKSSESKLEQKANALKELEARVSTNAEHKMMRKNTILKDRVGLLTEEVADLKEALKQEAIAGEEARAFISVLKAALEEKAIELFGSKKKSRVLIELQSLRQENSELRDEKNRLLNGNSALERENVQLQEQVNEISSADIDNLRNELLHYQSDITVLNEEKTALLEVVTDNQQKLSDYEDMEQRCQEIEAELTLVTEKYNETRILASSLVNVEEDKAMLMQEVSRLEKEKSDMQKKISSTLTLHSDVQTEKESLLQEHNNVQTEYTSLKHMYEQRNRECADYKRIVSELDGDKTLLTEQLTKMQEMMTSFGANYEDLVQEKQDLRQKYEELKKNSSNTVQQMKRETDMKNALEDQCEMYENEISTYKVQIDSNNELIEKCNDEIKMLEGDVQTLEQAMLTKDGVIDSLRTMVSELTSKNSELTTSVGELRSTSELTHQFFDKERRTFLDLQQQFMDIKQKYSELEITHATMMQRKDTVELELNSLLKSKNANERRITELEHEKGALVTATSDMEALNQHIRVLEAQEEQNIEEIKELKENIDELQSLLQDMSTREGSLLKEKDAIEAEYQDHKDSIKLHSDVFIEKIKSLQRENEMLVNEKGNNEQLNELLKIRSDAVSSLETENSDLEDKLRYVNAKNEKIIEENTLLKEQVEKMSDSIEYSNIKYQKSMDLIQTQKEEGEKRMQAEIRALANRVVNLNDQVSSPMPKGTLNHTHDLRTSQLHTDTLADDRDYTVDKTLSPHRSVNKTLRDRIEGLQSSINSVNSPSAIDARLATIRARFQTIQNKYATPKKSM